MRDVGQHLLENCVGRKKALEVRPRKCRRRFFDRGAKPRGSNDDVGERFLHITS
jgi:hypothetical protein